MRSDHPKLIMSIKNKLVSLSALLALQLILLIVPTKHAQAIDSPKWIQVYATVNKQTAIDVAKIVTDKFDNTHAFSIGAGWYVVALGPYGSEKDTGIINQVASDRDLPIDTEVVRGGNFKEQIYPNQTNDIKTRARTDRLVNLAGKASVNSSVKTGKPNLSLNIAFNETKNNVAGVSQKLRQEKTATGHKHFTPASWVSDRTLSLMNNVEPQKLQSFQTDTPSINSENDDAAYSRASTPISVSLEGNHEPSFIGDLDHPIVVLVDKSEQKMQVFIDGKKAQTWNVSTARSGKVTPSGTWTAKWLSKNHRSSLYNNAPMPFSIFYDGNFAIHGTDEIERLGIPASSGCIRLHPEHAKFLFEAVQMVGKKNFAVRIID